MEKLKLIKVKETVDHNYDLEGQIDTTLVNRINYHIMSGDMVIGEAHVSPSGLNINMFSGIDGIEEADGIIQKFFGNE